MEVKSETEAMQQNEAKSYNATASKKTERETPETLENTGETRGFIRRELSFSELIVEKKATNRVIYQIRMLQENNLTHMLKVTSCGQDNVIQYMYDVRGMKTLEAEFSKVSCNKMHIEKFLQQLSTVICEVSNYMLNVNDLVLDPHYIFVKEGVYYFCYCPDNSEAIESAFHNLTEFFVKSIDYSDYESVMLACGLHKETMDEQYDLKSLIDSYTGEERAVGEKLTVKSREGEGALEAREALQREDALWINEVDNEELAVGREIDEPEYVAEESGWELAIHKVGDTLRETIRETPIRKYWEQRKKERWGVWDDLLTQEESSIMGEVRK